MRLTSFFLQKKIGSDVCDFKFNPFKKNQLFTGTEDGKLRVWDLTDSGLKSDILDPIECFQAHNSKISFLLVHPFASNIVVTASPELGSPSAKVWNVKTKELISTLQHPDLVSTLGS